jgi:hypothetical protein
MKWLRAGLALLVALDCVLVTRQLFALTSAHHAAIYITDAVVIAALALFAARRAELLSGFLALIGMAVLVGAHTLFSHGPHRSLFASGAVLLGWLGGTIYSRALGTRRDDLAKIGATAALAAVYVSAAASKLVAQGFGWADTTTLRAVLLSQRRVDDTSRLGELVIAQPAISQLLAAATLVIQGGAFLMLFGRRIRAVWAALLIGFHLSVMLTTGIAYSRNMMLLALLGFPWPDEPEPTRDLPTERRVFFAALTIAITLVALSWLLPLRRYTLQWG